ncbi:hypothetical protein SAMN04488121_109238 [Chitinophaga filiformis]|uniref:Uncharacterized protein n=1 Tax=Chitinophaga filiformis TaxID=104663 RepID=A0A1G8AG01_CHIFI|nr:hypothetical protein SAMN04488121_109238 [Chitinophaga filiformis]
MKSQVNIAKIFPKYLFWAHFSLRFTTFIHNSLFKVPTNKVLHYLLACSNYL